MSPSKLFSTLKYFHVIKKEKRRQKLRTAELQYSLQNYLFWFRECDRYRSWLRKRNVFMISMQGVFMVNFIPVH